MKHAAVAMVLKITAHESVKKPYSRFIVGATLEVIQKWRTETLLVRSPSVNQKKNRMASQAATASDVSHVEDVKENNDPQQVIPQRPSQPEAYRCDNEPAPWTSDQHGNRPRPLPAISELKKATSIIERRTSPSWDFEEKDGCWKWKKPPPTSKKIVQTSDPADQKRSRRGRRKKNITVRERLLREFSCLICKEVMTLPMTTSCAHNFCKSCLEGAFTGKSLLRERNRGGRTLRTQKNVMSCPSCSTDISDFLQNPQVNRELMNAIESLKSQTEEEENGDIVEEMSEDVDNSENEITEILEDEGIKEYKENSPTNSNSERSPKRQKVDAVLGSPKSNESHASHTNGKGSAETNVEELNENPVMNVIVSPALVADCGKPERLKAEEVVGEGNGSPSSPLLVQSDFE